MVENRTVKRSLAVGIAGLGAIGAAVGRALIERPIPGLVLTAVAARDPATVERRLGRNIDTVDFTALAERCDVVVECLPRSLFRAVAEAAIARGRILIPLSVGALLDEIDLIELAEATGARILVPTGALLGLDAVRAAAESSIASVRIETRKPPQGLRGAPYLEEHAISIEALTEPKLVFSGSAGDGARGFPANVNVAAALSLAGIGARSTTLDIWADPTIVRNTHRISVESDSARLTMTIENIPTDENPKTGKITALSTLAALRGLVSTLKVGS